MVDAFLSAFHFRTEMFIFESLFLQYFHRWMPGIHIAGPARVTTRLTRKSLIAGHHAKALEQNDGRLPNGVYLFANSYSAECKSTNSLKIFPGSYFLFSFTSLS